jgi:hypothetical protein
MSNLCRRKSMKRSGRCAGRREGMRNQNRAAVQLVVVEIMLGRWQRWGALTRDFSGSRTPQVGRKREKSEEEKGFI